MGNILTWKNAVVRRGSSLLLVAALLAVSFGTEAEGSKAAAKITLNRKKLTIVKGRKAVLKTKVTGKNKKVVWHSQDKKIATVNAKGVVTAKKAGKVKITARLKGTKKKAVCVVTVKKKASASSGATASPTASSGAAAPTDAAAAETPSGATASPEPASSAAAETASPAASADADDSGTDAPAATPSAEEGRTEVAADTSGAVVAAFLDVVDGEQTTIYLLDRNYSGSMCISFQNVEYVLEGSVKEALVLLKSGYATRTNSAGTIQVSRQSGEEYWTVTDLQGGNSYYMKAESKNTYDTSYTDCGAVYFKGDVTGVISVY